MLCFELATISDVQSWQSIIGGNIRRSGVSPHIHLLWCINVNANITGIVIHSTCCGKDFSDFILGNFGPTISLPTVITVLLSMTNNTELLSLHFEQSSKKGKSIGWIRCLAHAIKEKLGSDTTQTLFSDSELSIFANTTTKDIDITSLAKKLSKFLKTLGLYPYNQRQEFTGTLKPVSHDSIQPALLICPRSAVCLTLGCNQSSLKQNSQKKDITRVTLIKGMTIHPNVQLLSRWCSNHCWHRVVFPLEKPISRHVLWFPKGFPMETQKVFLKEKSEKHIMCFFQVSHR